MVHPANPPSLVAILVFSATTGYSLVHYSPGYSIRDSPMLTSIAVLCASLALLAVYLSQIWPKVLSPLRRLPQAPNPSFWHGQFSLFYNGEPGEILRNMAATVPNDGLVRYTHLFNQEVVLLTSPEALREVLVTQSYNFVKSQEVRDVLGRIVGNGILITEGETHKHQRKSLTPAFHYRQVKDLVPIFWSKSASLLREIDREHSESFKSPEGGEFDFTTWLDRCTLDIIGVAGMGFDFEIIKNPVSPLNTAYRELFAFGMADLYMAIAELFLPKMLVRSLPIARNRNIAAASGTIREESRKIVRRKKLEMERNEGRRTDGDILSIALESGAFTDENLADQMMTFLAAGHETTSSAVSWALYALAKDQRIQQSLRDEVRRHLPSPKDDTATITAEMVDRCHYLHAVCNESLRVYSPVVATSREVLEDTTVLGTVIKKGTEIAIAPAATNVDEALWGPDAGEFRPERWLDGNTNSGGASSNFAMLTFLHGPRSCIGQDFARREFACLLASIVGHYQFRLDPEDQYVARSTGVAVTRPVGGLPMRVRVIEGW